MLVNILASINTNNFSNPIPKRQSPTLGERKARITRTILTGMMDRLPKIGCIFYSFGVYVVMGVI